MGMFGTRGIHVQNLTALKFIESLKFNEAKGRGEHNGDKIVISIIRELAKTKSMQAVNLFLEGAKLIKNSMSRQSSC